MHKCLTTTRKITQIILFATSVFAAGLVSAQPVGVSWQWVNPLPNGNPIKAIAHDGTNFVAVGSNQSVRRSSTALAGSWGAEVSLGSGTANDILWAGTLFVLVGDNGVIKTSPDGIAWTSRNSTTTNNLNSVIFTGTTLVVVGDNSTVLASVDAITWVAGSLPTSSNLNGVAWNGSLLAATGTLGKIYTSPDALNWTERVSAAGSTFNDITASGQSFVAVGNSGVIYSSNSLGTVWNQQANGFGTFDFFSAAWDGTQFVAAGSSGLVITSPLGSVWSLSAQVGSGGSVSDILLLTTAVAAGQYFMVGDGGLIYSSSDFINWTVRQPETSVVADSNFDDISFNGSQYLAVGTSSPIASSADGITWNQISTNAYASVIWDGAQYVGVGNSTKSGTSPDGITWTDHNLPANFNLQKVIIAHNGSYIAVSTLGDILTSVDANTWTQQASPTSSVLNGIAASASTTVIVGADGVALASTNLTTWTQQTLPNLGVKELTDIVFGNNQFVAVGSASLIYTSPDGTNWTERTLAQQHNFTGVTWDGNQFLAVGQLGEILTSVDTINWTVQTSVTVNNLSAITSDATKAVAVGSFGTIVLSQAVNQAPVPTAPAITTNEDTTGTSQIAANDPDLGETFSYSVTTAPTNGNVTVNATGLASYVPNANFNGSDSFVVTVTDSGGLTGTVTINATINAVNDPPAPTAANITTNEDTSATSLVSPNDPDVGNTFTYTITGNATNGIATVGAGGLAGYLPNPNFNGSDSFVVTVTDNTGLTGTVTINVTVNAVNDAPVPTAPAITTNEDTTGSSQIAPNDPDVGDTFTYSVTSAPTNGAVSVNATGLVSYVPNANFNGSDSFTITVTDAGGLTGTVTINATINAVNDVPAPTAPNLIVNENMSGTVQVNANDPDIGDTFTYTLASAPANGVASVNTTGLVSYTPNANFNGTDIIPVLVTDAAGGVGTVAINVTVNGVNQAPVPSAPPMTTNEDKVGSVTVLANDPDVGDTITFSISTPAVNGTASINATGQATYTPNADFNGTDTFVVTATDAGGLSGVVTVDVTIIPVNDAPTITSPAFSVQEDGSGSVQLTVTDPDVGDTFTYAVTTTASNGSASVDTNGLVSYTPNPKFNGSDSFTVTVTDAGGLTGAVTVNVTINPVNNPPEVTIPTITVNGRQVSMQINVTDPDVGDTHTFTISTPPQHGTATISTSGLVNYTADSGYLGDDSLTVTVTDSAGASVQVSASFSITENAVSNIETNVSDNGTRGGSMGWLLGFLLILALFNRKIIWKRP